nr:RNA-directed DNA polymerase, eukaryota [Tanacetum cinerariifolium]
MGGFHLFSDVAKYGRTNNRLEERSGVSKPNKGMNTQHVRDNANVFQSCNSYAKAVLENKSVGVSGNNDASNSREKPMGVSVSNKANEELSNEALMFISEDDCIDLDGMERSILAKVKDLNIITDLLKYMCSEGFVDVGLRCVGGRWVWLEFDSTDQVESVKNSKVLNEIFLELKDVSYDFIPDERCVWIDFVVCHWHHGLQRSLERKDDEGPSLDGGPEHEEPLDSSKDDNNDSDSSSEMSSTSRLMREVDVRGVDNDHVDSFKEGEIIGDSILTNEGCVKDCMEKNLDDDVEKDIEDCSKNVTEKCGVVNNNMSNNVEGEILEDHFDGDRRNDTIEDNADVNPSTNVYLDVNQNTIIPEVVQDLSSLNRSSDKAERLAHHNNGLDDLDISLRNRLLHQNKCRARPVKAAVNDSSIVSPSTPPGTVLNLAEESCSTWLDYIGFLITDELDSEKRWSYRDPDGIVQGSFSLAQLRMLKDYFPSDLKIWSYYGHEKETILLHSALKRRRKDVG